MGGVKNNNDPFFCFLFVFLLQTIAAERKDEGRLVLFANKGDVNSRE